ERLVRFPGLADVAVGAHRRLHDRGLVGVAILVHVAVGAVGGLDHLGAAVGGAEVVALQDDALGAGGLVDRGAVVVAVLDKGRRSVVRARRLLDVGGVAGAARDVPALVGFAVRSLG